MRKLRFIVLLGVLIAGIPMYAAPPRADAFFCDIKCLLMKYGRSQQNSGDHSRWSLYNFIERYILYPFLYRVEPGTVDTIFKKEPEVSAVPEKTSEEALKEIREIRTKEIPADKKETLAKQAENSLEKVPPQVPKLTLNEAQGTAILKGIEQINNKELRTGAYTAYSAAAKNEHLARLAAIAGKEEDEKQASERRRKRAKELSEKDWGKALGIGSLSGGGDEKAYAVIAGINAGMLDLQSEVSANRIVMKSMRAKKVRALAELGFIGVESYSVAVASGMMQYERYFRMTQDQLGK